MTSATPHVPRPGQSNFAILAEEIAKRVATHQNGSPTTIIGPPTSGTRVLNEFWRDAMGGEFRCTQASTPGTWIQIPESGDGELLTGPARNLQVFDPLSRDCGRAEVTQHIPDRGTHLVRCYGWYSNKTRGQRPQVPRGVFRAVFLPTSLSLPQLSREVSAG